MFKYLFWFIAFSFCGTLLLSQYIPDGRLHIYFLDVGQGDCVLIQSPNGRYIMLDAGPDANAYKKTGEITGNFRRKIDILILSHAHADHFAGFMQIIKNYEVGLFILPKMASKDPGYALLLEEIQKKQIKTAFVPEVLDLKFGRNLYMDFINVQQESGSKDENENSFFIKFIYGNFSLLAGGDAPEVEEVKLLKTNQFFGTNIFKASHHGSKYSNSENFLKEISPKTVVIQSGIKNTFGHPHQEALKRFENTGAKILRNDLLGTVELISN